MKAKFLILACVAVCLRTYGLGMHYVKNFDETPYGPFGQTWQIAEYGGDNLYFANKEGLYEYDGAEWRLYRLANGGDCRSVFADTGHERILLGGINEFGSLRPGPQGQLVYTCLSDSLGKNALVGNLWGIYSDASTIYVQGDYAVIKYNEATGDSRLVSCPSKINKSAMVGGIMYLATDDGLKMLIGDNIVGAYASDALRGQRIRTVLPYDGGVLLVTPDSGVYYYNEKELRPILDYAQAGLGADEVFCGAVDGQTLALGTIAGGVVVVDLQTGIAERYDESAGLNDNTVLSLLFDQTGNLWVGMDSGVAYIMLSHPATNLLPADVSIGSGYTACLYGDRLYLGTNRGLYYLPYDTASNRLVGREPVEVGGMGGQVWMLAEVDGDLLCMHDHGLYRIDGDTAERIGGDVGIWSISPFAYEGRPHAWLGTYEGILLAEKADGRWQMRGQVVGYTSSASNLAKCRADELWVQGKLLGITRLNVNIDNLHIRERRDYTEADFPWVHDANIREVGGEICFATPGGIYRYDRASDAIVADSAADRRMIGAGQYLRYFQEGPDYVYAVTPDEVVRARVGDGTVQVITVAPQRTRPMFDSKTLCLINDSTVVYPNYSGFTIYDFGERHQGAPGLHNYARINRVIDAQDRDKVHYQSNFLKVKPHIELPYDHRSVVIEYGMPIADNKNVVKYRYRLDDGEWSQPTTMHSKEYATLSPGSHTFQVEAVTSDGHTYTDSIELTVMTPWYRTVWAIIGYVVLVIVAIALLLMVAKSQVGKRQRLIIEQKDTELEHQREQYEREREIKDEQINTLEQEKLQSELSHKSQEIVNLLLSISSKNEALIGLKDEIQRVANRTATAADTRKALLAVQSRIDDSLRSEAALQRVEEEFDLVHNNFMKKLKERYPALSTNELIMCAYIKMNLSTKEIAPLLNISTRGVETMRYRLRKKFDLSREDNLTEFLSQV